MKIKIIAAVAVLALGIAGGTNAVAAPTYTYVGSWTVDQGPRWNTSPVAYSGQSAAAHLFGGSAADYVISTIDNLVADINFSAWVSTWGGACGGSFPCGTVVAQDSVKSTDGLYLKPGDTSAYVWDWAQGRQYTNYAFRVSDVPEPATVALLGLGLAGIGFSRRKKA